MAADNRGKLIEGTVAEKTHKMCQNAKTVLEAAGSGLERVVKFTVSASNSPTKKKDGFVYSGKWGVGDRWLMNNRCILRTWMISKR